MSIELLLSCVIIVLTLIISTMLLHLRCLNKNISDLLTRVAELEEANEPTITLISTNFDTSLCLDIQNTSISINFDRPDYNA